VEVIIVDTRPATGETLALVSETTLRDRRFRYVAEPRKGSSLARNRGVTEAVAAPYVALTDGHAVVDRGWLRWLLAPFADKSGTATSWMVLPLELQTTAQKRFEQAAFALIEAALCSRASGPAIEYAADGRTRPIQTLRKHPLSARAGLLLEQESADDYVK
jgi:Glycosyl transferase family 2